MNEYHYRVLKSDWFISIKIIGDILQNQENEKNKEIYKGIFITYSSKMPSLISLSKTDRYAIETGLYLVRNEIISSSKFQKGTLINILDIMYDFFYFQEEGLVVATMYWAADAFGFELSEIKEGYDKENKRYTFLYKGEYLLLDEQIK